MVSSTENSTVKKSKSQVAQLTESKIETDDPATAEIPPPSQFVEAKETRSRTVTGLLKFNSGKKEKKGSPLLNKDLSSDDGHRPPAMKLPFSPSGVRVDRASSVNSY
mmetsp:Transcript_40060/g.61256  ORF Transcript_40060/g.61256 Transcript_40060/m.61256 type:complete len:107 (-) Transcript_40060:209-529(-)